MQSQISQAHNFHALEVALELIRALKPLLEKVHAHDRELASQLRRAASSVPLCLAEGARRAGKDRTHMFRIAAGSAAEVKATLEVALAWGYVEESEGRTARELLDRVLAMLWRLARPRG